MMFKLVEACDCSLAVIGTGCLFTIVEACDC